MKSSRGHTAVEYEKGRVFVREPGDRLTREEVVLRLF